MSNSGLKTAGGEKPLGTNRTMDSLSWGLCVAASVLCWTSPARAYLSMPSEPIAHKVAAADCVVLGKITAIQAKPAMGQVYRYSPTPEMAFAIVEVEVKETLYGPKD